MNIKREQPAQDWGKKKNRFKLLCQFKLLQEDIGT